MKASSGLSEFPSPVLGLRFPRACSEGCYNLYFRQQVCRMDIHAIHVTRKTNNCMYSPSSLFLTENCLPESRSPCNNTYIWVWRRENSTKSSYAYSNWSHKFFMSIEIFTWESHNAMILAVIHENPTAPSLLWKQAHQQLHLSWWNSPAEPVCCPSLQMSSQFCRRTFHYTMQVQL